MNWELIFTFIGALGGVETIKWLATRRQNIRLATAEADVKQTDVLAAKEHLHEDIVIFLQNQLKEKECCFAEQGKQLRESTQEIIRLTREIGRLETELQSTRCIKIACPDRDPPLFQAPSSGKC